MSGTRIIKKYPNRRLYDTEISRYVTLGDIRKLVLIGVEFRVTDVKTEEDITRNILLQIIAEQEHDGKPIFNTQMLTQLIRFYGNTYQTAFSEYLQKSLEVFASQQQNFQKNFQQAISNNPFAAKMTKLTERNIEMWQQMQDSFFKASGISNAGEEKTEDEKNQPPDKAG